MRTLRRWSGDDSAPLIFVTSKSDPAEVGEGLAAGGVADLAEPFRKPAVLARIRIHLLNRRRIAPRNKNDRAKNRLLCMAAHDLRNPPVSIRALANLLRNGTVGDVTLQQRDVLDPVYDASEALLKPVNDLLAMSVLVARELTLILAPPVGHDAGLRFRQTHQPHRRRQGFLRRLAARPPAGGARARWTEGPAGARQSARQRGQIFATGFDDHRRDRMGLEPLDRHGPDQGPGILDSERIRLFQDFGRTSAKPTGGEPSTGLGLAICYKILPARGGSIRADNRPEAGAAFRITFALPI